MRSLELFSVMSSTATGHFEFIALSIVAIRVHRHHHLSMIALNDTLVRNANAFN